MPSLAIIRSKSEYFMLHNEKFKITFSQISQTPGRSKSARRLLSRTIAPFPPTKIIKAILDQSLFSSDLSVSFGTFKLKITVYPDFDCYVILYKKLYSVAREKFSFKKFLFKIQDAPV